MPNHRWPRLCFAMLLTLGLLIHVRLIYREVTQRARIPARRARAALNADSSSEIIKCAVRAYELARSSLPLFRLRPFTLGTAQTSMLQYSDSVGRATSALRNFHRGVILGEEDLRVYILFPRAYVRFVEFFLDNLFALGHDLASQRMIYKYCRLYVHDDADAGATHVHKYVLIVRLGTSTHGGNP